MSKYFGMTPVTVAAAADMKKLTEAAPDGQGPPAFPSRPGEAYPRSASKACC